MGLAKRRRNVAASARATVGGLAEFGSTFAAGASRDLRAEIPSRSGFTVGMPNFPAPAPQPGPGASKGMLVALLLVVLLLAS